MTHEYHDKLILGGGVTGLAAGIASGATVLEAENRPGGICSSYYVRRNVPGRLDSPGEDGDAYRFEHGGGHWIFGGHSDVVAIVQALAPCDSIERVSSVFFPGEKRYVGFPLQHHLHQLAPEIAARAVDEVMSARARREASTMAQWLEEQFGPTLADLFFHPFHEAYTAGLWREIAPQDGYKTPLDLQQVLRGAQGDAKPAGYNVRFLYPRDGLDALIGALAERTQLHCGQRVVAIDPVSRELTLDSGRTLRYRRLLSTLPLNHLLALCGIANPIPPDPYTSVLVLNIGAERGPLCPDDHWLYIPRSDSGFHRVGFYSNVCRHFLPRSLREGRQACSIYVERSYRCGQKPNTDEMAQYIESTVRELREWGFIGRVEALDSSWVEVAYTWSRPGSTWAKAAMAALSQHEIQVAGRYARWAFQGITDSLRDGFLAGQALRVCD